MRRKSVVLVGVALACLAGRAPAQQAAVQIAATSRTPATQGTFAERALNAHNRYRKLFGVKPLQWDPELAVRASGYGPRLAQLGTLEHSPRDMRRGQGENLWRGTRGAYSIERMIDYWAEEREHFVPGVFPNSSSTRNWIDVSHYTQMIWPETTHVGCHLEQAVRYDYLICRYSPKGNRDGRILP